MNNINDNDDEPDKPLMKPELRDQEPEPDEIGYQMSLFEPKIYNFYPIGGPYDGNGHIGSGRRIL